MSWMLRLQRGFQALLRKNALERDMGEEMRFHVEMEAEDLLDARGLTPDEARRQALIAFGGVERYKDQARDVRMTTRFEELGRDLRYGLRTLVRSPGFTAAAVLTLALGIGATTAIFSVVDGVLLERLPYPQPDRIVRIFELERSGALSRVTDPNFADLRERNRSLRAMAQFRVATRSVSGGSEPARMSIAEVSGEFFDVIGVHPVIGRAFVPEEQQIGAVPAVVVAHGFWVRRLGARDELSAIRLRIDDQDVDVVGVMPPGFEYPIGAELWIPRELRGENARTAHNYEAIGRLADGVSLERAAQDVRAIARELHDEYGEDTNMADAGLLPLHETIVGDARPALLLLFGGAAFLLLIACANVVNLLLARAASRQRELAVRLTLGAGRVRIARAFLTESLLLSLAGGILGVLLAAWGVDLVLALEAGSLTRAAEVRLDADVLAFAFGVSVLTAGVLGLSAAWRASGDAVRDGLAGSRGATSGRASERVRAALVVSQVGMTMVLLIGAGLLGRSLLSVLNVDAGFRTQGAAVMDVALPPAQEGEDARLRARRRADFLETLVTRLRTIPGVQQVGVANALPLGGSGSNGTFLVLNYPDEVSSIEDWVRIGRDREREGHAEFRVASGGYFRAMGIPLVGGRLFGPADGPDAPHVAVISESLAKTQWPGEDPVGKFIQFGNMDGDIRPFTVIGIVADIREASLEAEPRSTFYTYYRQRPSASSFSFVMHGASATAAVISDARRIAASLDPDLPVEFRTLAQIYSASLAERRFGVLLVGTFAATALALAVMGVYGVISFAVAQRTREIGIRMALGARAENVLRLVLKRGLLLAGVGTAIGIGGALAATRLLTSFLFGVSETDATTFIAVPLILIAAALIAAYVPARRAMRVDPMIAIRAE
ncbi:MAG: ADOP family duplicated permease [Longimicrobiales bacterium]